MTTLRDIAASSGYSVMTASRVLSGRGYVSAQAGEAVRAAAAELGYVANGVARSLRRNRTGIIALIISDIENAFYAGIAKTAEDRLDAAGFRLFISTSNESAVKERQLLRTVLEARAEALIITPTAHNGDLLRDLAIGGLSIVQVDRSVEHLMCSSVLLDNEAAGYEAIEYLVKLGHRQIAFISGPRQLTTGEERALGALRAGANLHAHTRLEIVEARSYLRADAVHSVREALNLQCTAIVAGNNVVAEACMEVFSDRRIGIPTDISLLTFDDLPWMRWLPAPLTAIQQPVHNMTIAAIELVLESLGNEAAKGPEHLRFPATLIGRDSVAKL